MSLNMHILVPHTNYTYAAPGLPYRHVLIDKNFDKEYGLGVGCGASSVRIYTSESVITMQ